MFAWGMPLGHLRAFNTQQPSATEASGEQEWVFHKAALFLKSVIEYVNYVLFCIWYLVPKGGDRAEWKGTHKMFCYLQSNKLVFYSHLSPEIRFFFSAWRILMEARVRYYMQTTLLLAIIRIQCKWQLSSSTLSSLYQHFHHLTEKGTIEENILIEI